MGLFGIGGREQRRAEKVNRRKQLQANDEKRELELRAKKEQHDQPKKDKKKSGGKFRTDDRDDHGADVATELEKHHPGLLKKHDSKKKVPASAAPVVKSAKSSERKTTQEVSDKVKPQAATKTAAKKAQKQEVAQAAPQSKTEKKASGSEEEKPHLSRRQLKREKWEKKMAKQLEEEKAANIAAATSEPKPKSTSAAAAAVSAPASSGAATAARPAVVANPQSDLAAERLNKQVRNGNRKRFRETGDDLLESFKQKLSGSTFRLLNEELYTSPNALVSKMLNNAKTYNDYHEGYRVQMKQWPVAPTSIITDALLNDKRGKFLLNKEKHLPGRIPNGWVIADMGCGDAAIAKELAAAKCGATVKSFDLCAANELVTACDMANVPLGSQSTDCVCFVLSLMATDWEKYLFEAHRILKTGRSLKIIEVRSRMPKPEQFVSMVEGIGFKSEWWGVATNYFVAFDFTRQEGDANRQLPDWVNTTEILKPCIYKRR